MTEPVLFIVCQPRMHCVATSVATAAARPPVESPAARARYVLLALRRRTTYYVPTTTPTTIATTRLYANITLLQPISRVNNSATPFFY